MGDPRGYLPEDAQATMSYRDGKLVVRDYDPAHPAMKLEGKAAGGIIHLINSGSAALDGTGEQSADGQPVIKPWWEIEPEEAALHSHHPPNARKSNASRRTT